MKPRSHLSDRERRCRSRVTKLVHDEEIIIGSLVEMRNTCGKPNCRCTRGEKHRSLYLSYGEGGKRKMVCIPKPLQRRVRAAVETHKSVRDLLAGISEACLQRIVVEGKQRVKHKPKG